MAQRSQFIVDRTNNFDAFQSLDLTSLSSENKLYSDMVHVPRPKEVKTVLSRIMNTINQ